MTEPALRATEFFNVSSGHLTERGIKAILNYCFGQGELPEGIILPIQEHIGLCARSKDFRHCNTDCQEKILDRLGSGGEQIALDKGIFTAVAAS